MQDNSFFSKYRYIRQIGQGGSGRVFLAENTVIGNMWAVKEIAKDGQAAICGYIEPDILKYINHPALPRICDLYEDENKIYIVEDYIEGNCLKEELDKHGRFKEDIVVEWAIQLCNVLTYLHNQRPNPIIYGDMKPQNILLTKDGFLKLVDFGVSAFEKSEDYFNCTIFIGTRGYAAPEQFKGQKMNSTTDIYSLGITIIQLVTGLDPLISEEKYSNETYSEYMSSELFKILRTCIQTNPERRYQTAESLNHDLQKYNLSIKKSYDKEAIRISKKTSIFSKILVFTGARGSGISTITFAIAEQMARGPDSICIVDLSVSASLSNSIVNRKEKCDALSINKIKANLYYINLSSIINETNFILSIHKYLSELQGKHSYILIDADMAVVKDIAVYINHIFIVTDMNPFNARAIGQSINSASLVANLLEKTAFIINKYYKKELDCQSILRCLFIDKEMSEEHHIIISNSKTYDVPYDKNIYIKWAFSFWGEPLRFNKHVCNSFCEAILNIISDKISPKTARINLYIRLVKFITGIGGTGNWEED